MLLNAPGDHKLLERLKTMLSLSLLAFEAAQHPLASCRELASGTWREDPFTITELPIPPPAASGFPHLQVSPTADVEHGALSPPSRERCFPPPPVCLVTATCARFLKGDGRVRRTHRTGQCEPDLTGITSTCSRFSWEC